MYNNSVQIYQEQFHQLVAANFSSEQAEAIMRVIEERQIKALGELATKHDLAEVRTELKHEIALLEKNLNHRMTVGFFVMGALCISSPHLPDIFRFIASFMKP